MNRKQIYSLCYVCNRQIWPGDIQRFETTAVSVCEFDCVFLKWVILTLQIPHVLFFCWRKIILCNSFSIQAWSPSFHKKMKAGRESLDKGFDHSVKYGHIWALYMYCI